MFWIIITNKDQLFRTESAFLDYVLAFKTFGYRYLKFLYIIRDFPLE